MLDIHFQGSINFDEGSIRDGLLVAPRPDLIAICVPGIRSELLYSGTAVDPRCRMRSGNSEPSGTRFLSATAVNSRPGIRSHSGSATPIFSTSWRA